MGPSLDGVVGRSAGADPDFGYTDALTRSGLRWDAPTLIRFLEKPQQLVPGTSMLLEVDKPEARRNLVAYLGTLSAGASGTENKTPASANVGQSTTQVGDRPEWLADKPGREHYIDPYRLPVPTEVRPSRNHPRVVPRPKDARLEVPPGFDVHVFATGFMGPRRMIVAPGGDVFVTEPRMGRVTVLRPTQDGVGVALRRVFADGLAQPFGMAFHPAGKKARWLYVAEVNRVVRYAYRDGQMHAPASPEVVVPQLAPITGGHSTRDIAFSADGRQLFISVGSQSNVADAMLRKTPTETKAWEAEFGVGAAWGNDINRAAVLVTDADGRAPVRAHATGLRNCVGLTRQPATGDIWCTVNERDLLGDQLVPDYSTRIRRGAFFGWPWYYIGANEDPRHEGARPDLRDRIAIPDVLYEAHSAAMTLTFYPGSSGDAAFPKEYVGDAFVAFHGSWNRDLRTGHKVVRVRMRDGIPTGKYEDFLTGFVIDNEHVYGRPVATAVAHDGALLLSEDGNGTIYRIAWHGLPQ